MKLLSENNVNGTTGEATNWFFVLSLATFFSASGLSLLVSEHTGNSTMGHLVLVGGLAALLTPWPSRRQAQSWSQPRRNLQFVFALIGLTGAISCLAVLADPFVDSEITKICFVKTAGLLVTLLVVLIAAPLYRSRELVLGLACYCILEFCTICVAYLVFRFDYNQNAVGNRTATIGLVSAACFGPLWMRATSATGAAAVSILLQCRTSAMAFLMSLIAGAIESRTRHARFVPILFVVLMAGVVGVFGDEGMRGVKDVAKQNLGSENPVAKFFLSDKNRTKVDSDFLDRGRVWKASLKLIAERPFFGWGVGTESERRRVRSHNAYLSLAYEGGVLYLIAWLVFYLVVLRQLLSGPWATLYGGTVVGRAMVYLISYMVLSALMESSGLGSISTPSNIILLFLVVWSSQWFSAEAHSSSANGPSPLEGFATWPTDR